MSRRPNLITAADRRARLDALRHMIADGSPVRAVRSGMGLSIRQMPRDVYLPIGMAKRLPRRSHTLPNTGHAGERP
ncbi:MAG TPA: hypothetical protein VGN79_12200 [Devosia sp.]|jgi:hypothetical protein|nr:hypothetical protein [Devosia sp.]